MFAPKTPRYRWASSTTTTWRPARNRCHFACQGSTWWSWYGFERTIRDRFRIPGRRDAGVSPSYTAGARASPVAASIP